MSQSSAPSPSRSAAIDVLKGILIVLMISAHAIQLLVGKGHMGIALDVVSHLADICCFSGFIFAFGYGCYRAYFKNAGVVPHGRMLRTAARILVGYYLSGAAFLLWVQKAPADARTMTDLLLLNRVPGYCEFLPAFSLTIAAAAALHGPIRRLLSSLPALLAVAALLLAATFLPCDGISITQVGLFVGSTRFCAYPVVQYFPLFLAGAYFAANSVKFRWSVLAAAAVGVVVFAIEVVATHHFLRFPPSLAWILGSAAGVYLLFLFSHALCRVGWLARELQVFGRNALFCLVASNVALFAEKAIATSLPLSPPDCVIGIVVLLAGIRACVSMVHP
jgi:hypothetical protein